MLVSALHSNAANNSEGPLLVPTDSTTYATLRKRPCEELNEGTHLFKKQHSGGSLDDETLASEDICMIQDEEQEKQQYNDTMDTEDSLCQSTTHHGPAPIKERYPAIQSVQSESSSPPALTAAPIPAQPPFPKSVLFSEPDMGHHADLYPGLMRRFMNGW